MNKYSEKQRSRKEEYLLDLFNIHSEMILREVDVLLGFIIVWLNLNIRYADDM